MPRTLSANLRRALYAQETGEAVVLLLALSHPQLQLPIRVCNAGGDVVSGGQTYPHFPFEVALPPEDDVAPPSVELRICNVDREIVRAVRSLPSGPMQVELSLVLLSAPDQVEAGPFRFSLRDVRYDAGVVSGQLMFEDVLNEPYPADAFTPSRAPGLFKG